MQASISLPVPELRLNYLAGAGGSSNYHVRVATQFEMWHGRPARASVKYTAKMDWAGVFRFMTLLYTCTAASPSQFGLRLDLGWLGSPGTSSHVRTVIKSPASYEAARPQCGQGISHVTRAEVSPADSDPSSGFSIRFTTIF